MLWGSTVIWLNCGWNPLFHPNNVSMSTFAKFFQTIDIMHNLKLQLGFKQSEARDLIAKNMSKPSHVWHLELPLDIATIIPLMTFWNPLLVCHHASDFDILHSLLRHIPNAFHCVDEINIPHSKSLIAPQNMMCVKRISHHFLVKTQQWKKKVRFAYIVTHFSLKNQFNALVIEYHPFFSHLFWNNNALSIALCTAPRLIESTRPSDMKHN